MRRIVVLGAALGLILMLASPALAEGTTVHVVQRGENLFRIALRYGLTTHRLASANGLSAAYHVWVGQRLTIPGTGSATVPVNPASGIHVVRRGENLYRIALRYGLTTHAVAVANGIVNTNHVYVGQRLRIPGQTGTPPSSPPPAPSSGTYVVRRGDTLAAIALRHRVSVWALSQANSLSNPSLIYVGQVLRIPGGANPAPPALPSPSPSPTTGRWIDVNLSAQRLTAYQGNTAVRSTLVSTGLPATPTLTGRFRVYVKYASTPMSGPGYYLPGVPYTMYYDRGYGIHGTYWHSNFGHPMSHGCINLPTPEAGWLFSWAAVGTLVNIHY